MMIPFDPVAKNWFLRGAAMKKESVKLSRAELFEKIWSTPATKLAEEFGISGRGLGKMCARFDIPVPPRGYWAKLAAGKPMLKTPLPASKPNAPDEIRVEPTPDDAAEKVPEAVRAELETVLEKRDLIRVSETLSSPHPIVANWIEVSADEQKSVLLHARDIVVAVLAKHRARGSIAPSVEEAFSNTTSPGNRKVVAPSEN
jgi:hypothetical protein